MSPSLPMVVSGVMLALAVASTASLATASRHGWRVRRRLDPPPTPSGRPLAEGRLRRRVARALHDADVSMPADEVVRLAVGAILVGSALGLLVAGPAGALLMATAGAAAGPGVLMALRGRRAQRVDAGLAVVLDDVARALRGGSAEGTALAAATDGSSSEAARQDVRTVVMDIDAGLGLVEALDRWSERRPSPAVRLAVGALAIGASTGGARSRAVEAVAASLRERRAVEREAVALATQARSSALVIALAPLAFAALSGISDPRAGAFLVGTPVGLACLSVGLGLNGLGAWWMHRIVHLP